MTCPTCKKKILDPYELEGIEYCCPNCAYNRDENTITITPNNVENLFKAVHLSSKMSETKKMKIKPIKAYAIVKNNKIDVLDIYKDKDVVLNKDEKLVLVEIKVIK